MGTNNTGVILAVVKRMTLGQEAIHNLGEEVSEAYEELLTELPSRGGSEESVFLFGLDGKDHDPTVFAGLQDEFIEICRRYPDDIRWVFMYLDNAKVIDSHATVHEYESRVLPADAS